MNDRHVNELRWMAEIVKGMPVRQYLEVGCRNGLSIRALAKFGAFAPGALLVAIDLPGGPHGIKGSEKSLQGVLALMERKGYRTSLYLGNSHSSGAIKFAQRHGQFDLCYIDGDHSYDGVRKDFKNYAPLSRVVALDDVFAVSPIYVNKLWKQLQRDESNKYLFTAYADDVTEDKARGKQGIGMVFRRDDMRLSPEDEQMLEGLGSLEDIR